MYKLSREKGYSWYPIDEKPILYSICAKVITKSVKKRKHRYGARAKTQV